MSDVPVELIVAAFNDEKAADQAMKQLKAARKEKLIGIQVAAVVRRDERNRLHVKEMGEFGSGKGALGGAALGVILGVLTGGTGLILGAVGALAGGLTGKVRDIGIPNERLKQLGDALKPGTSAIVAVIEHKWVDELQKMMEQAGADVLAEAISADVATQLAEGKDVAYSMVESESGTAVSRVAGDAESMEMSSVVSTEEALVATAAVATKQGMAAERLTVTGEGAMLEEAVVDEKGAAYMGVAATAEGVAAIAAEATFADEAAEVVDGEVAEDAAAEDAAAKDAAA